MNVEGRQLWWCWILNEPFITEFPMPSGRLHCHNCDGTDCVEPPAVSEGFLTEHSFMQKISKPTEKQTT